MCTDDNELETLLERIKVFEPITFTEALSFIRDDVAAFWAYDGFVLHNKYNGKVKFELHTMGWSDNEEIIEAILANWKLRMFLGYCKWERGGHYYFEVRV